MLLYYFSLRQFRLTKWSFFENSTTPYIRGLIPQDFQIGCSLCSNSIKPHDCLFSNPVKNYNLYCDFVHANVLSYEINIV